VSKPNEDVDGLKDVSEESPAHEIGLYDNMKKQLVLAGALQINQEIYGNNQYAKLSQIILESMMAEVSSNKQFEQLDGLPVSFV